MDKHRLHIQRRINYLAKYIMGPKTLLHTNPTTVPFSVSTVNTSRLAYNRISMIYNALEFAVDSK